MIGRPMRNRLESNTVTRRVTNRRTFEINVDRDTSNHLRYFISQELGYFNTLVEKLTPKLRAFPQDLLSMKDREKKVWETCAEHAVDPQKLLDHPIEEWPENLRSLSNIVRESDGTPKFSPAQITMMRIAAEPARLHKSVRRLMASEVLRYMTGQAETVLAGMKTEGLRAPVQLLNTHTLDTKRHLQIPGDLVKVTYDQESNNSSVAIPYSNKTICIEGYDISEIAFKSVVIRSPHPTNGDGKWYIDFKDSSGYSITMTDHNERRRR